MVSTTVSSDIHKRELINSRLLSAVNIRASVGYVMSRLSRRSLLAQVLLGAVCFCFVGLYPIFVWSAEGSGFTYESSVRVLFITRNFQGEPIGSTALRGFVTKHFIDTEVRSLPFMKIHTEIMSNDEFLYNHRRLFSRADICVFVKWERWASAMKCRLFGATVIVDRVDSLELLTKPISAYIDLVLESSDFASRHFRAKVVTRGKTEVVTMYHPHSNFKISDGIESRTYANAAANFVVIADSGLLPNMSVQGDMAEIARTNALNYFTQSSVPRSPSVADTAAEVYSPFPVLREQNRHHRLYNDVGICVIWPKNPADYNEVCLRPITRLVTCLSHGIPTLFYPYKPYEEIVGSTSFVKIGMVSDLSAMNRTLKKFFTNHSFLAAYRTEARKLAKSFTYTAIARRYVRLFCMLHAPCRKSTLPRLDEHYAEHFRAERYHLGLSSPFVGMREIG
eukprot:gene25734-31475_t